MLLIFFVPSFFLFNVENAYATFIFPRNKWGDNSEEYRSTINRHWNTTEVQIR